MYRINIDLPHLAEGAELQIAGLGVFTVGGDNFVPDDVVDAYEQTNLSHEPAFAEDEDGNKIQVGVSQVRKTFPELLENLNGVSVEVVGDEEEAANFEEENEPDPVSVRNSGDPQATGQAEVSQTLDLTAEVPPGFPALPGEDD